MGSHQLSSSKLIAARDVGGTKKLWWLFAACNSSLMSFEIELWFQRMSKLQSFKKKTTSNQYTDFTHMNVLDDNNHHKRTDTKRRNQQNTHHNIVIQCPTLIYIYYTNVYVHRSTRLDCVSKLHDLLLFPSKLNINSYFCWNTRAFAYLSFTIIISTIEITFIFPKH